MILLYISILCLIFGIILFLVAFIYTRLIHKKKESLHLPKGEVTYADLHTPARPLFSQQHHLVGKPDYILKQGNCLAPVEYKSGKYDTPAFHHILQLAAYCQLIEDTEQINVSHGWIVYPSGRFRIPFDLQLRHQLTQTIDEIRGFRHGDTIEVNHQSPRRCRSCSYNMVCPKKLS